MGERQAETISGTLDVFPSTIVDQNGTSRPIEDTLITGYFVQGEVGSSNG